MLNGRVSSTLRWLLSYTIFKTLMLKGKRMVASSRPAIIFAPHQDDETFGCGGLIAKKARVGARLKVVFLTDGAGSCENATPASRSAIAARRRAEVLVATAALGLAPEQLEFLPYADGSLSRLSGTERVQAVERIAAICREFGPDEIYLPHRNDKHPDHEATYGLVSDAAHMSGLHSEFYEYAIWLIWWANRGPLPSWRDFIGARTLAIADVLDRKQQAMMAFESQLQVLPPGFLDRFHWPHELYFQAYGSPRS